VPLAPVGLGAASKPNFGVNTSWLVVLYIFASLMLNDSVLESWIWFEVDWDRSQVLSLEMICSRWLGCG